MGKVEEGYPILIEVDDGYWVCSYDNIQWIHINEN